MLNSERTIVDERYEGCLEIIQALNSAGSLSQAQVVQELARRTLVIGAASLFEEQIKTSVVAFVEHRSKKDTALISLVRKGFVDRGFHQMFNWSGGNANSFFAYFGDQVGSKMKNDCKNSAELEGGAKKFLELGDLRNCIVHQNFHVFYFEKSLDEAYADYKMAKVFVDYLLKELSPPPVKVDSDIETNSQ